MLLDLKKKCLFQNRCSQVQLRSDKMEMEMMEARVYRTPELNGDLSEEDDIEGTNLLEIFVKDLKFVHSLWWMVCYKTNIYQILHLEKIVNLQILFENSLSCLSREMLQ